MKDLVIVGAGPIGIYAGTLASLHGLNAVLIEGQEEVGGQLTALYPEKDIVDLPGFKRITAKGFIDELMIQFNSEDNKTELLINEQVKNFEKVDDYYKVNTSMQPQPRNRTFTHPRSLSFTLSITIWFLHSKQQ